MNPYDVLEVPKEADDKDIKESYKQLARKWHPDKNKAPNAEEKFKEINKAYNILINPELRQRYDQFGTVDENEVPNNVNMEEMFRGMGGFPFGGMPGMGGFPFGGMPGMGGFPGIFVNGVPMGPGMNPQEMFMRKQSQIQMIIEMNLNSC